MTVADSITAISAVIAAISFVFGVSSWKREFVGRRRIELAETVLAKFYEAADVIRDVRSPHGRGDEGLSRQPEDNERPEETRARNQAHVLFERWNKHRELFAELQSLKYRFMATFGKSALEPFTEFVSVRNDMVIAANRLADLWARGDLAERDQQERRTNERIFWSSSGQTDEIAQRVTAAVQKVENLLEKELRVQARWWRRAWQWCASLRPKLDSGTSPVASANKRGTVSPS